MAPTDRSSLVPSDPTKRPPQTARLRSFAEGITRLNGVYWSAHAGFAVLEDVRSGTIDNGLVSDQALLAKGLGQAGGGGDELWLRSYFLVNVVTSYEVFLGDTAYEEYSQHPPSNEKSIKVALTLDEVDSSPLTVDKNEAIHRWAREKADRLVGQNYRERIGSIEKLVGMSTSFFDRNEDAVKLACETRHCIVHDDGIVRARTKAAFDDFGTNLLNGAGVYATEGDPIPLSEQVLFALSGALKAHAEDLDLHHRIGLHPA